MVLDTYTDAGGDTMRKLVFLVILLIFTTGCMDLSAANLFGCKEGQRKKPTARSMFGGVKYSAECLEPDDPRYPYYQEGAS